MQAYDVYCFKDEGIALWQSNIAVLQPGKRWLQLCSKIANSKLMMSPVCAGTGGQKNCA
jgi:hypothetical protein